MLPLYLNQNLSGPKIMTKSRQILSRIIMVRKVTQDDYEWQCAFIRRQMQLQNRGRDNGINGIDAGSYTLAIVPFKKPPEQCSGGLLDK